MMRCCGSYLADMRSKLRTVNATEVYCGFPESFLYETGIRPFQF